MIQLKIIKIVKVHLKMVYSKGEIIFGIIKIKLNLFKIFEHLLKHIELNILEILTKNYLATYIDKKKFKLNYS